MLLSNWSHSFWFGFPNEPCTTGFNIVFNDGGQRGGKKDKDENVF